MTEREKDERPIMTFAEPLTGWTLWWAWHPVRTWDFRWRWLCCVERRLLHLKPHLDQRGGSPWWQHRLAQQSAPLPYPFGNEPFI